MNKFTVGSCYENRHNHRRVRVVSEEMTDTGVVLFKAVDIDDPEENIRSYFTKGDKRHWITLTPLLIAMKNFNQEEE